MRNRTRDYSERFWRSEYRQYSERALMREAASIGTEQSRKDIQRQEAAIAELVSRVDTYRIGD